MRTSLNTRKRFRPRLVDLEERVTPVTFNVTSNANTGAGTLREAVGFANGLSGADTITFASGLGTIVLTSGELAISEAVTIQGPGSLFLQINGNNASRIFNSSAAPAGAAIDIIGLSLFNGKATGAGGAILGSGENLTLTDCFIAFNASTGSGGGLATSGGSISLIRCQVTANQAGINGGGVDANSGAVVSLTDCTVANNKATNSGGGLGVGSSSLTILRSTISGNLAIVSGGGLYFAAAVGASGLTIRNSTLSGNSAAVSGGGIVLDNFTGTLTVQNSTITSNTCTTGSGGGIARVSGTGFINLVSSVVAGNTATANSSEDLFSSGTVTATFCAIGTSTGVGFAKFNTTTDDLLGQNFKLGALASNGGPTQTHLPASDSPILNLGTNSAGLLTDQRGSPFVRSFGAGVDIGAVEVQNAFVVTTTADSDSGSLREAVTASNGNPGTDTITFDAALFATPQTITLTTGEIAISQAVTITGTGAALVAISGNKASGIFNTIGASAGTAVSFSQLTMTEGRLIGAGAGNGAAINANDENLTLFQCALIGNTAVFGGAVNSASGNLTFDGCTFSGNRANQGGAISTSSTVLTMTGCTVSGNSATTTVGGGIRFEGNGAITIRNSTISGNTAPTNGGGLVLINFGGIAQIRNSTFTQNHAGSGGGIGQSVSSAAIFIESSILSDNVAIAPDVYTTGAVNTVASLFGSISGITTFNADASTVALVGKAPLLGPLQDNGGPTFTHMPEFGSPVIDKGLNPAPALTYDQRGVGYPRQRGAGVDIGTVETLPTFVVTNTNNAGAGSLRQAMLDANAAAGTDAVLFDPILFASPQTITLTTGELAITQSVTIHGTGAANVTISGNNASRIFNVAAPLGSVTSISGLTLTGGNSFFGGAIYVGGTILSLANCVLSGNTATFGGALYSTMATGARYLMNCTFSGNQATNTGGAICNNYGDLTMTNCTVSGNSASTLNGGGVYFRGSGTFDVRNSTFSGNSAGMTGGGIGLWNPGLANFLNSTITLNTANKGGGIGRVPGTGAIFVESSIVSGNTAITGPEVYTAATVNANASLIGSVSGITTLNVDAGTLALVGKAALLGPLQDNGGPTLTHLPAFGSPAINQGLNSTALSTDQRGMPRSFGITDIGSVELQTAPPGVTSYTVNGGDPQRSRLTTIQVNFASPMDAATLQSAGAITMTRTAATGTGTVGTIVNTTSGLIVSPVSGIVSSVTLTFANVVNPGVQSGSLADGRWQLAIPAASYTSMVSDVNLRRLFGDSNNDGTVDGSDLAAFGADFGSSGVSPFDFNNDLTIDALDFGEFGNRFGLTL